MLSDAWFLLPAKKRTDLRALFQFLEELERELDRNDRVGGGRTIQETMPAVLGMIRDVTGPDDTGAKLTRETAKVRSVFRRNGFTSAAFVDFYDGLQSMRVRQSFRDSTQFDQHVRQVVLGPGTLVRAVLTGEPVHKPGPAAMTLARAWATVTWMTRLPQDLNRGRLYIPLSRVGQIDLGLGRLDDPAVRDALLTIAAEMVAEQEPVLAAATEAFSGVNDLWSRRWATFQVHTMRDRARRFMKNPRLVYTAPEKLDAGWRDRIRLLAAR